MCDNAYNQSDSADLESEGRVMSNVINMSGGAADLQSKTVTPSTSQQVVRPDTGKDGLSQVTVAGDANLVSSNIVAGKSIFGVSGNASVTRGLDVIRYT